MATRAAIPPSSTDESTTPRGQSSKAKFCWGQRTMAGGMNEESKDSSNGTSAVVSLADVMSEQLASQTDGELKYPQLLDPEISGSDIPGSDIPGSEIPGSDIPYPDWDPGLAQAIRESLESSQADLSSVKSEQSSSAEGASGGAGLDTDPTGGVQSPTDGVQSPTGGVQSPTGGVPDTSSDEMLALLLQEGFDAEFQARRGGEQLCKKRCSVSGSPPKEGKEGKEGKEKRYLDHSFTSLKRGTLSSVESGCVDHSDHSTSPESVEDGREREGLSESEEDRDWDRFEGEERTRQTLNKRGFALGRDGKVSLTKHDSTLCARRNASKVMEFNTQIRTGDGAGFDMKLSNNVYNALRKHVVAEEKR